MPLFVMSDGKKKNCVIFSDYKIQHCRHALCVSAFHVIGFTASSVAVIVHG